MLSSLFPTERHPEEYTPLLTNRYNIDDSDIDSDSDTSSVDLTESYTQETNDWLFSLINWDQIFDNAATFLHINFRDYDYDRYASTNLKTKQKNASKLYDTSVDTFNYFLSSLTNNRINMNKLNQPQNTALALHKRSDCNNNNFNVSIYEIIYDRVAKSRLYSLKHVFDAIYPDLNVSVNRIVAEIVSFELAPDTLKHMIYKSIISEYHKRCRPSFYKTLIVVWNWAIYLIFFAVHIMWLQFVWMDFLKHFNWTDSKATTPSDASSEVSGIFISISLP